MSNVIQDRLDSTTDDETRAVAGALSNDEAVRLSDRINYFLKPDMNGRPVTVTILELRRAGDNISWRVNLATQVKSNSSVSSSHSTQETL